ncbi:MAG: hypothetical protein AAFO58_13125, partial [Pseudomonadota bacterium]
PNPKPQTPNPKTQIKRSFTNYKQMLNIGLGGKLGLGVDLGLASHIKLKAATEDIQSKVNGCMGEINAQLGASVQGMKAVAYHAENEAQAGGEYTIKCMAEGGAEAYKVVLTQAEVGADLSVKSVTKLSTS